MRDIDELYDKFLMTVKLSNSGDHRKTMKFMEIKFANFANPAMPAKNLQP